MARKLSFDAAASETFLHPSPPGHPNPEEATTPRMPDLGPGPHAKGPARGFRFRSRACRQKPKAASKAVIINPREPSRESPEPLPAKAAAEPLEPLPAKPECMKNLNPTLQPDKQQPPKPKGKAKAKKCEDEEEEEEGSNQEETDDIDGEALEKEQEEEAQAEDDEADDEPPVLKRPAAKSSQKQEKPKAKTKAHPKGAAKSKAKAKAKVKAGAKAKAGSKDDVDGADKALKSRKSVAYHRAKKEAIAAGMTVEEACEIGKAVTYLHA